MINKVTFDKLQAFGQLMGYHCKQYQYIRCSKEHCLHKFLYCYHQYLSDKHFEHIHVYMLHYQQHNQNQSRLDKQYHKQIEQLELVLTLENYMNTQYHLNRLLVAYLLKIKFDSLHQCIVNIELRYQNKYTWLRWYQQQYICLMAGQNSWYECYWHMMQYHCKMKQSLDIYCISMILMMFIDVRLT